MPLLSWQAVYQPYQYSNSKRLSSAVILPSWFTSALPTHISTGAMLSSSCKTVSTSEASILPSQLASPGRSSASGGVGEESQAVSMIRSMRSPEVVVEGLHRVSSLDSMHRPTVAFGHVVGPAVGDGLAVGASVGVPYQFPETQYLSVGDVQTDGVCVDSITVGLGVGVFDGVGVGHGVWLAGGEGLAVRT